MKHDVARPLFTDPFLITHTELLLRSHHHWTGRPLLTQSQNPEEGARLLFEADFVLVSHGTEPDPILNYGNQKALQLWEMSWTELTRIPSRLTAEAVHRDERARLMARVTARGWIEDYRGVRISKSGRRFMVENATVWNLLDADGQHAGQAAMFRRWTPL